MIARYAGAIGIGAAVTLGLLFLMQTLIAMGEGGVNEARRYRIVDFVRVEREQRVETKQERPEKPPEPERPPEMPRNNNLDNMNTGLAVSMSSPQFGSDLSIGGVNFGVSDGEYLPIVKVAPVYPARAAQRGIEGHVIVEFTVTTIGTTRDITIVESSNSVFDRAAVDAAAKFKYRPRVIDGQAVEVPGVRNLITFVLEQ